VPVDLDKLLTGIFDLRYFNPDETLEGKTAIPYVWDRGASHLVLVQGENAGGKSFFRRVLRSMTAPARGDREGGPFPVKEMIHLSMEGRTDTGLHMDPVVRAIVYGDEDHFATGVLTAGTVRTAITAAAGRTHSTIVYWDEPDIGLSASAAAAVGILIRDFVDSLPAHIKAVVVTSHSTSLVAQLLKGKDKPHYVHLGIENAPPTAAAWVTKQSDPNIEPRDLDELRDTGITRFRMIQKILDDNKREREAARPMAPSPPISPLQTFMQSRTKEG
jgi:hypothetical protein